jgi:hypothetical protein
MQSEAYDNYSVGNVSENLVIGYLVIGYFPWDVFQTKKCDTV